MSVLKINSQNFDSLRVSDKPVLLDFYADWCGPCRMVSPIVDDIARERGDIVVCKISVDESPELASRFGIFSIPTLLVMRDGTISKRLSGARPKSEILNMLNG